MSITFTPSTNFRTRNRARRLVIGVTAALAVVTTATVFADKAEPAAKAVTGTIGSSDVGVDIGSVGAAIRDLHAQPFAPAWVADPVSAGADTVSVGAAIRNLGAAYRNPVDQPVADPVGSGVDIGTVGAAIRDLRP